jgi:multidrug efflux system membrane fusion protein
VRFDGDEQAYLKYTKLARENAAARAKSKGAAGATSSAGEAGAEVMVGLANEPGYPHQGVMVFVDNELDPTTGTIRGRARLDNHDRAFTPGLFARVKVMGSNEYDALLINDSAIGTDQTVRYVLVVGADNKVQYRPVKLGPIIDGLRVVTDGLKPGETIVVSGLQRVRPGATVNPERVAMGERHHGPGAQSDTMYARTQDGSQQATPATASSTARASTGTGTSAAAQTGTTAAASSNATPGENAAPEANPGTPNLVRGANTANTTAGSPTAGKGTHSTASAPQHNAKAKPSARPARDAKLALNSTDDAAGQTGSGGSAN